MGDFDITKWNRKRYLAEMEEAQKDIVKVQDLELGVNLQKGQMLPEPQSDYSIKINNESDLERWKKGKDPSTEVHIPHDRYKRIEIPEFDMGREEYSDLKGSALKNF